MIELQSPDTQNLIYSTSELWITVVAAIILTIGCVLFHYEVFAWLSNKLKHSQRGARHRIVYAMLSLVVLHVIEIWFFGIAFYGLSLFEVGALDGLQHHLLYDYVYYSAVVYTTVGFGDITPLGPFQLLTGLEALLGLALITWSASFTFLQMSAVWAEKDSRLG